MFEKRKAKKAEKKRIYDAEVKARQELADWRENVDATDLFEELAEFARIVQKANKELDNSLINTYTGQAMGLVLDVGYLDKTNNPITVAMLDGHYYYSENANPLWRWEVKIKAKETVKDVYFKVLVGIYTNKGRVYETDIIDVYLRYKELSKRFPSALKLLIKLN